jgi:hypothetical protein
MLFTARERSSEREMMLNSWMFGVEVMQQGLQAQSALAFRLMRSFAGGAPDKTKSIPLIPDAVALDIKAQEEAFAAIAHVPEAPAAITDEQEAPVAIAEVRRRKSSKALRVSKKTSRVKARSVPKRAAAARQKSAVKAVRRSARKPR